MEIGTHVRLIQPEVAGVIQDTRYNKDAKCLEHLLTYNDANGEQSRWFLETELEAA